MEDLNDIYFFASVVQYGGFSAAARSIGVEKTRLSRRIAALEKRLGVRLLQRTTRAQALTEAGQRFFERCVATVEGAQAAYDSVAELRREPAGLVRLSSPVLLAQRCLAHVLPDYMTACPRVSVFLEATDRTVNVIEELRHHNPGQTSNRRPGRTCSEDSRSFPARPRREPFLS
jgi:DNA-binding transcriptional LysR family regulator